MSSTANPYTADYYKSSNYADYLERADRYKKTAYELVDLLRKLGLIDKESWIVDFGCAVGFLLEGFDDLGYRQIGGYDVSDWAIAEGRARGNDIYKWDETVRHTVGTDILTALDVFEHMEDDEIRRVLKVLSPKCMILRIPTSVDGGKTFALEVSRQDPTHINCKTKEQWIEFFRKEGFGTFLRLNLFTIYDTPGVTCLLCLPSKYR
jgi:2-polyprenyl-3-methyl-5-hydroxy-6-metoxy-1,4-benzoquinol methylase